MVLFILCLFIAAYAFVIYYFLKHDKGEKEPVKALIWVPIGYGLLAIVASVFVEAFFIPAGDPLTYADRGVPIPIILIAALMVGLIEEAAKFFPAAFFLRKKTYFNEYADGVIYFAFLGLAFGLVEDFGYILGTDGGAGVGIARFCIGLYLHAGLTAIIGFYFIEAKIQHRNYHRVVGAFFAVAGLHALYDFGLLAQFVPLALVSLCIGIGLNVMLFRYYKRAVKMDGPSVPYAQAQPVMQPAYAPQPVAVAPSAPVAQPQVVAAAVPAPQAPAVATAAPIVPAPAPPTMIQPTT